MPTAIFEGGKIKEYLADVVTSEEHNLTSQVSSFAMENGSVRSDHIIFNPEEITISFELNNQENEGNKIGDRATGLYKTLKDAMRSRDLFEVITLHHEYKNMVIADIQAVHAGAFTGRLNCVVRFVEFPEVKLVAGEVPGSILKNTVEQTASSQVDTGRKEGEEVSNASIAKQLKLGERLLELFE